MALRAGSHDESDTTESISLLKKSPDKTVIQDIALELGIDPSFIEKDWYAVQLLVLISELQGSRDINMVFSGGHQPFQRIWLNREIF